ncbi:phage tail terminator family protein [Anaerocolumna chitinilytica]|uniref:DUF3168 domain-containing protein n=1 Tax=Anaerocolumna chitinilytica TaxID=1727145 RepID=A0A7I8DU61_9FIRM|nr:hypothetical protein [Anaerocolumna chitinilytica]BCK00865.1 hypothetical protein bsdcttw_39050 [Anaerocolumna chitinilytica]
MVRQADIVTAINTLLIKAYPAFAVYLQPCPKDFLRPSFLIELIKSSQVDLCRTSIEKTVNYKITCYTGIDQYNRSDPEELAIIQQQVLEIFGQGYVTVGERALKVKECTGTMETDKSFIELQLEYVDNRTDEVEQIPMAASVTTKIQEV